MKAVVFTRFGGPDVLTVTETDEPHAGSGQVRVRTLAAAVNPADAATRAGAMQAYFPTEFPAIPGIEVAGIVDEVGEGVTGIALGDEVFGHTAGGGGYAQYTLLSDAAHKPSELPWEVAAAIPVSAETSDRVLEALALSSGETLLVHGASGVTASVGIQIAVANGVTVIGTASPANHDFVRSLGAVPVAYGDGWVDRVREAAPQGIDAVWDAVGAGVLEESIALVGGSPDRVVTIADGRAYDLGVTFSTGPRPDAGSVLEHYARRFADGELSFRIDRVLPIDEAVQAQEVVGSKHAKGKIVLQPWSE
jgi:NADPH:quinone reductase-like Zn-dependent oxidoreductase